MKQLWKGVLIACLSLLLVGCGALFAGPGRTLTVAVAGMPAQLDPFGGNDRQATLLKTQLYDTLFVRDGEQIVPSLVASWQWEDDRTFSLTVRSGVFFDDHTELGAKDVLFSLRQAEKSPHSSWIVRGLDLQNATVGEDPRTLLLPAAAPSPDLLASLCFLFVVKETSATGKDAPAGTGPFLLVRRDETSITLQAKKDHWRGAPSYDRLVFRIAQDSRDRTELLLRGEADIITDVPVTAAELFAGDDGIQLLRSPSFIVHALGFRTAVEPFSNPSVRRAVASALDKEELLSESGRRGAISAGPLAAAVAGSLDEDNPSPRDLALARALLAEAGYANGLQVVLAVPDEREPIAAASAVRAKLLPVGIDVRIKILDRQHFLERLSTGQLPFFLYDTDAPAGSAEHALINQFYSGSPSALNVTRYHNERVDLLLQQGRSASDPAVRERLYKEAQRIILEDCPAVFLADGEECYAARSDVRGLSLSPSGMTDFRAVFFAEKPS